MMTFALPLRTGIFRALTSVIFLVTVTGSSYASPGEPGKITITPQSLEQELFAKNPDLVHAMNAVAKARDQVNIARGELLPSLSLSGILSKSTPLFLLSSVSCLVPFLFPSKWFDLKTSRKSYHSEQIGLQLTRLNIFATAYTLISRIESDEAILQVATEQAKRFNEYLAQMKTRLNAGLISLEDYELAEIESRQRDSDLSRMRQLLGDEHATLRKLFGYPIGTEIKLALTDLPITSLETSSPASIIDHIIAVAPERQQLDLLSEAAKSSLRSTQWSFLAGCGGSQNALSSVVGGNSFNLSTGVSVNFGFGYFPRVKLARHNAKEIDLRKEDLSLELGRILEDTIVAVGETKIRLADAEANVKESDSVLTKAKERYVSGRGPILDVIRDYALVAKAKMDAIADTAELTGHRITLNRLSMGAQFGEIFSEGAVQK